MATTQEWDDQDEVYLEALTEKAPTDDEIRASERKRIAAQVKALAPAKKLGPHSQFVKGYNRALREVLAGIERTPSNAPAPSRR